MPKITAPTVAEHRVAQRRALIDAAEAIVSELGATAVTPRSVRARAGLARSWFYEYFPFRDDLLAAIALQAFDEWGAELRAAVAAASPGRARLHAYVEATMRMTADGKHSLALKMQRADLSPKNFDAIMAMHDTLTAPLTDVLGSLGLSPDPTHATLVQGLLNAGVQLVEHGVDAETATSSINSVLDAGLHA